MFPQPEKSATEAALAADSRLDLNVRLEANHDYLCALQCELAPLVSASAFPTRESVLSKLRDNRAWPDRKLSAFVNRMSTLSPSFSISAIPSSISSFSASRISSTLLRLTPFFLVAPSSFLSLGQSRSRERFLTSQFF